MIATRITLILSLISCAPPGNDGIRTPENWTLDKNSMYRDLRDGLLSENEKHAFEVIHEQSLDADADGVEDAVVEAGDNIEAIADMIKTYHEQVAINKTIWQALLDYEDATCFMRRDFERLEVHLRARIGFKRQTGERPAVELLLGLPDLEENITAEIIDGGATVFRYDFAEPRLTDMEDITQITVTKKSEPSYHTFKYPIGHYCGKRAFFGTGWCTKTESETDTYYYEGDTVIVDGIDIYAIYPDDTRKYKIYSSLPTADHQPLAILSGTTPTYRVPSHHNNPYWVMHYHSSDCDGWGSSDHDNSAFGREVWNKYASKGVPIGSNVFRKNLSCNDKTLINIPESPPDFIDTYYADQPLPENVWTDSLSSLESNIERTCDPIDVDDLINQAKKNVDTIVLPEERINFKPSADHKPEVLQEKRQLIAEIIESINISNTGQQENFNDHYRLGCFYDRELRDGINIEVKGQVLQHIGGRLFSAAKAKELIDGYETNDDITEKSQLFIGFGYSKELAYLGVIEGEDDDGTFTKISSTEPGFTENFALHDLSYVHVARNFSEKFFKTYEGQFRFRDDFWGSGEKITTNTSQVERRLLSIYSIQLSIGKEGDHNDPKKVIYELNSGTEEPNEQGVIPALFVLSNSSSAWTDYGLKGNLGWIKYRRANNLCDDK